MREQGLVRRRNPTHASRVHFEQGLTYDNGKTSAPSHSAELEKLVAEDRELDERIEELNKALAPVEPDTQLNAENSIGFRIMNSSDQDEQTYFSLLNTPFEKNLAQGEMWLADVGLCLSTGFINPELPPIVMGAEVTADRVYESSKEGKPCRENEALPEIQGPCQSPTKASLHLLT